MVKYEVISALVLIVASVVLHGMGLGALMRYANWRWTALAEKASFVWDIRAVTEIFLYMILLHFAECCVWAEFYRWKGFFRDFESSLYFSITSYSTLGYGDLLLPKWWRVLGSTEAILGILTFGWSTAVLVTLTARLNAIRLARLQNEVQG